MTPRRVTLSDIAKVAGVHVTTVSLALRNHVRLPLATRQRLQELAKKMGYVPDPMMRALVSYRTEMTPRRAIPTLAYVTNWATRLGWCELTAHPSFFAGAEKRAGELGFRLDHFWLGEPGLTHARFSGILRARGINGIIVASHAPELGDSLNFDWANLSAVKIDYYPHRPALHNVTNNQCDIVRHAFQRVRALGYKRIGFVMHRGWDYHVDHLWTAGILCEQQHVPAAELVPALIFPAAEPVEAWMCEYGGSTAPDLATFSEWFHRHRPEVLISSRDFVLPLLEKMGLSVPKHVAFVDVFLSDTSGAIAGIRQNHEAVGAAAVELLAGQLQHGTFGIPAVQTTTFVEGTWFDGATCPLKSPAK